MTTTNKQLILDKWAAKRLKPEEVEQFKLIPDECFDKFKEKDIPEIEESERDGCSFLWSVVGWKNTPQKHAYWETIAHRLDKQLRESK